MFPIASHEGLAQLKCIVWSVMLFKEFQDGCNVAMVSKFQFIPYVSCHAKLLLNPIRFVTNLLKNFSMATMMAIFLFNCTMVGQASDSMTALK